ncbi:hypothetical protein ADUPG1_005278 [Aduncisulcus paluster]|uniref:Transposase n=1 Tax=Aduncisulcus paluster TaxID=2918883 RepID=A0ABQ5KE89_9EUKA|nr:hypothetical protein ADUPG1_005278 [Aduncisulcus paluster]
MVKTMTYLNGQRNMTDALGSNYFADSNDILVLAECAKVTICIVDTRGVTIYNRKDHEKKVIWLGLEECHFTYIDIKRGIDFLDSKDIRIREVPTIKIYSNFETIKGKTGRLSAMVDLISCAIAPCKSVFYKERKLRRIRVKCTMCGKFIITLRWAGYDATIKSKSSHTPDCTYQFDTDDKVIYSL